MHSFWGRITTWSYRGEGENWNIYYYNAIGGDVGTREDKGTLARFS
jgi:hypothetical protein